MGGVGLGHQGRGARGVWRNASGCSGRGVGFYHFWLCISSLRREEEGAVRLEFGRACAGVIGWGGSGWRRGGRLKDACDLGVWLADSAWVKTLQHVVIAQGL